MMHHGSRQNVPAGGGLRWRCEGWLDEWRAMREISLLAASKWQARPRKRGLDQERHRSYLRMLDAESVVRFFDNLG